MRFFISFALLFLALCVKGQTVATKFNEHVVADYYLQYTPLLTHISLDWLGAESKNKTADRIMVAGLGFVAEAVIVNGLKYTVREQRPDGSAFNSFPSGHTATAFLGAELVRIDYGWGWGAAAYAIASSVGALRVYHKRHYWWDTVAGAGCGVLSAHIGHWLLGPTKKFLGMDVNVSPLYDPMTGAYGSTLSFQF